MDEKLKAAIRQMQKGEEEGFNAVYSETYNYVYFHAKQIMKNEEDAKDLVQIVYVEAYRSIVKLQAPEALYKWLYGITCRQGMKIYRKKKSDRDVLLSEETEGMLDAIESNDIATMPELTADQKATSMIVKDIIEELPELQKLTVIAYYFDGLKIEQIAELMDCSANTVKSRLNYARKYIKERVEEKEKKEGYRLHVFGLPVFWFAIKKLSDETTLTVEAAQGIYDSSCKKVGLRPKKIKMPGQTAATAEESAGIAAKFASLSTTMKVAIIAGVVAVAGVAGGVAYGVHAQNKAAEAQNEQNAGEDSDRDAAGENGQELAADADAGATETETETETEESYELTEDAQRQISAFVAAAYQCNYSSVNSGDGWSVFSMEPDECLTFVSDYIGMVRNQMSDVTPNSADLPYDWYNGKVTTQEVHDFCKDGLGIEIPADYSYAVETEWGSLKIENDALVSTFDGRMFQVTGGSVEIVSEENGTITLSGNCVWYDPEETDYQFTVTARKSGNSEVLGGLTIIGCEVSEAAEEEAGADVDYQLMAEKYYEIAQSTAEQYNNLPASYYLNDIDKDDVPELLVLEGADSASYMYAIYQFDGTDAQKIGEIPYGTLYGNPDSSIIYSQYFQMDYEVDWMFDMTGYDTLFQGENPMQEDGYVGLYEFPQGTYQMLQYTATDVNSMYDNIMLFV